MAEQTEEQRRLKKERKVLRGTYTIMVPDYMDFEQAKALIDGTLYQDCPLSVEDHNMRSGWKVRT